MERAFVTHLVLVSPSLGKQFPDVFLGLAHKFAENFRPVDDLEIFDVQSPGQLTSNQGLARSRRAIKEDTLDMLDSESFNGVN
jgi:hypothetical protein